MKALIRLALLAGGALVAAAATGCSSSAGTTAAPSAPQHSTSSAGAGTSALSGHASTPATHAAAEHPDCDNAKLNASLAVPAAGQKASISVIAVKNVGPTCTIRPVPYLWISAGPNGTPDPTRPLVPAATGAAALTIASGTTLYAAIDLDPKAAANAAGGYTWLDVTANPTPDTSGKDVQELKLPAPAKVAGAMLGGYATDPAGAIKQIRRATAPEK